MPQPSVRYIEGLSSRNTEKLANLLSLGWRTKITLQWLSEQEQAINQLPSSLQKPKDILSKMAMKLPRSPQKAVLCPAHKSLNPLLIHRFFLQLSAECSVRLARLDENPRLPPNLASFLKRIHGINSLWFAPSIYRSLFKVDEKEECQEMIEGGCEACILSVVGTNHQTLCDLRASMLGRRRKRLPVPRLLKIVDAWIEGTGHGIAIRKDSDALEKEIRECRREMQKARRQTRRNNRDGIVDPAIPEGERLSMNDSHEDEEATPEDTFEMDGKEKDENAEQYFEGSILDYYTGGLKSSTNLASQTRASTPLPGDIHPAFRESMMSFDDNTGTFHLRGSPPTPPPKSTARGTWSNTTAASSSQVPLQGPPPPPSPPPGSKTDRGTWSTWTTDARQSNLSFRAPPRAASSRPRPTTTYTASVYSRNQFGDPVLAPSSVPDVPNIADTYKKEQERQYRNMMGIGEEDDEENERRGHESKLSSDRVSSWLDDQRP
jgi:hypothetical protein